MQEIIQEKSREKSFEFKLLTNKSEIFSSIVESVFLPGKNGEFGILANHSNLVVNLTFGLVKIKKPIKNASELVGLIDISGNVEDDNFNDIYFISNGGIAHFFEDKLIVFVDNAIKINDESIKKLAYDSLHYKDNENNNLDLSVISTEEKDLYNLYEDYIKSQQKNK